MPIYSFKLRSDDNVFTDDTGVGLPNPKLAYHYACDVVRELMRCRESETRGWSLEVHQRSQGKIFDIPFAEIDSTLEALPENWRSVVEQLWQRVRSLQGRTPGAYLRVHSLARGQLMLGGRRVLPGATKRSLEIEDTNCLQSTRDNLDIARRLYRAMCEQYPERQITLRDGGGRILAKTSFCDNSHDVGS